MEQICQDLSMEKVKLSDLPIISAPGIFRVFFFFSDDSGWLQWWLGGFVDVVLVVVGGGGGVEFIKRWKRNEEGCYSVDRRRTGRSRCTFRFWLPPLSPSSLSASAPASPSSPLQSSSSSHVSSFHSQSTLDWTELVVESSMFQKRLFAESFTLKLWYTTKSQQKTPRWMQQTYKCYPQVSYVFLSIHLCDNLSTGWFGVSDQQVPWRHGMCLWSKNDSSDLYTPKKKT